MTWLRLSDSLFKELDASGTKSPLLLVKTPALPVWSDAEEWPVGCTLFVPFQDPENVGAVIRSAAAFGVARVVLLREAAHPFHPKSARAAGPALFQVPLLQGPGLAELDAVQAPLIALATDGPALDEATFPERFGLGAGPGRTGIADPVSRGRTPPDSHRGGGRIAERGDRHGRRALRLAEESRAGVRMSGAPPSSMFASFTEKVRQFGQDDLRHRQLDRRA